MNFLVRRVLCVFVLACFLSATVPQKARAMPEKMEGGLGCLIVLAELAIIGGILGVIYISDEVDTEKRQLENDAVARVHRYQSSGWRHSPSEPQVTHTIRETLLQKRYENWRKFFPPSEKTPSFSTQEFFDELSNTVRKNSASNVSAKTVSFESWDTRHKRFGKARGHNEVIELDFQTRDSVSVARVTVKRHTLIDEKGHKSVFFQVTDAIVIAVE